MSNNRLKIVNEFGIKPKTSFTAAGVDFFIPQLAVLESSKKIKAMQAFEKSFNKTTKQINEIVDIFHDILFEKIGDRNLVNNVMFDVLHLFLALDNWFMRSDRYSLKEKIERFVEVNLLFKDQNTPGILLHESDQLKINSGIREALPTNMAGIFFNKSGRGNDGLDVMSCVVDEDYTGYVHLSVINNKKTAYPIYCGEKLVQQVIIPIYQVGAIDEIDKSDYDEIMKDSKRGENGFSSTGLK